jgi:hypothetical protein
MSFATSIVVGYGSITIKSENGAKFIAMMMGSIPLFCFATLNPIVSYRSMFFRVHN